MSTAIYVAQILLAIELSAALYRVPRGGPSREVWAAYLPAWAMRVWGSTVASGIWAGVSAFALTWATGAPWWLVPIVAIALFAGEAPGYPKPGYGSAGVAVGPMTRRGLLLLNPLMGVLYWAFWRIAHDGPGESSGRLKRIVCLPGTEFPFLDGWSAWAEWFCGRVTAASYVVVLIMLSQTVRFFTG